MARIGKDLDEICIWLRKLLSWVDRCGPPPIPYAGRAGSGYVNPPAPHIEIIYFMDSRVDEAMIGDRVVAIPAWHVALHNVHQGNYTARRQRMKAWCVFVDVSKEREFDPLQKTPLFFTMPVTHREQVAEAFRRLAVRCTQFGGGPASYLEPEPLYEVLRDRRIGATGPVYVKTTLMHLLAVLLDEAGGAEPGGTSGLNPLAVQKAIEFIGLNYRRTDLNLKDIASAAHLSVDHFGRLFRQATDETPMRYLRRVRIRQSRFLLAHSNLLVEEVALEAGFGDPFHFSRVFRAEAGMSPRAYRQLHSR